MRRMAISLPAARSRPGSNWACPRAAPLAHTVRIRRKEQRGIELRLNRADQRRVGLDLAQRGFEFGNRLRGHEVEFVEQQQISG